MVLEETPESPLDSEEIKPVNLKGRTDAETGAPVFWQRDASSRPFGKVPDASKD